MKWMTTGHREPAEDCWGDWLVGPPEWSRDAKSYVFAPVCVSPVLVELRKTPPSVLLVQITTESGNEPLVFHERIPALSRDAAGRLGLHVMVRWQLPHVELHLNGKLRAQGVLNTGRRV